MFKCCTSKKYSRTNTVDPATTIVQKAINTPAETITKDAG